MKELELSSLDMKIYSETLENGLEIYFVPYEKKKNYYISYATKFGSDILKFDYENEEYTPPLGIAHYLEHKMFETPSGEDPFTFFSESGTGSNAMTSYDNTKYICYGTKRFEENLRYLLNFVNEPYFTDENVEKEKGIIAEEIKMYEDLPDYKMEMKLRGNIYKNNPRKNDIAGTVDEIKKITKEDLYKCYNSFYTPNNMFVLVVGNFDMKKAEKIIKEELKDKKRIPLPKVYNPKEPKNIVKKEEIIYEEIEVPKVGIGVKIPRSSFKMNDIELDLYLSMLTTILFGSSSEFKERVRIDKLLNDIYTEWESTEEYKVFYIFSTTLKPDSLVKEIEEELDNISISEKSFERIKKVWIANEVKIADDINRMQRNVYYDIIFYNKLIPNKIDLIKKMNINKLNKLIKTIDFTNRSKLIVLNKNK